MPAQPRHLAFPASTPTVPIGASAIAANEVFSTLHLAGDATFVAGSTPPGHPGRLHPLGSLQKRHKLEEGGLILGLPRFRYCPFSESTTFRRNCCKTRSVLNP